MKGGVSMARLHLTGDRTAWKGRSSRRTVFGPVAPGLRRWDTRHGRMDRVPGLRVYPSGVPGSSIMLLAAAAGLFSFFEGHLLASRRAGNVGGLRISPVMHGAILLSGGIHHPYHGGSASESPETPSPGGRTRDPRAAPPRLQRQKQNLSLHCKRGTRGVGDFFCPWRSPRDIPNPVSPTPPETLPPTGATRRCSPLPERPRTEFPRWQANARIAQNVLGEASSG